MIIPSSKYPSQIDVTDLTNYPRGKARNVVATGEITGTPLEKDWINDWFGFQQAAIVAAGITPSGTPDTAVASQLLDSLKALMLIVSQQRYIAAYQVSSGVFKNSGLAFPLTAIHSFPVGAWVMASGVITVPAAGKYKISFQGIVDSSDVSNPKDLFASIAIAGATTGVKGWARRYSATTSDAFGISGESVVNITNPAVQTISLFSSTAALEFTPSTTGTLIVELVG